jgi:uncharacterized membrane protein
LIIVGLLVGPLVLVAAVNQIRNRSLLDVRQGGCLGIALVFFFTGIGHFIKTEPMAEMLPNWVPGRIPLVYMTGVLELAAAVSVAFRRWRNSVGWALIVMLLLFLPVNVHAALHRIGMGGHLWGPIYLLIRVPLQLLLVGWTWWFAVRRAEPDQTR